MDRIVRGKGYSIYKCWECKGFNWIHLRDTLCDECRDAYYANKRREEKHLNDYNAWAKIRSGLYDHSRDNYRRWAINKKYGVEVKPYSTDEVNPKL